MKLFSFFALSFEMVAFGVVISVISIRMGLEGTKSNLFLFAAGVLYGLWSYRVEKIANK